MKSTLWACSLLLVSATAFSQPQNAPSTPSPNVDEMSDYQAPLPNEGKGTSEWSERQAQEERQFNKNRDYDREERAADWDDPNYEEIDPDEDIEDIELDE